MNETRKELAEKLKYLRKNWKDVLKVLYPWGVELTYNYFLHTLTRSRYKQQSVMCSNGQDLECVSVTEIEKDTLLQFVQNLPDDCFITIDHDEDGDDYVNYTMSAWYYRKETDKEYLLRINDPYDKVINKLQKKRCDDTDVNQYIEHLEKLLASKEQSC